VGFPPLHAGNPTNATSAINWDVLSGGRKQKDERNIEIMWLEKVCKNCLVKYEKKE